MTMSDSDDLVDYVVGAPALREYERCGLTPHSPPDPLPPLSVVRKRRRAVDELSDDELCRHLKLGGGVYLDEDRQSVAVDPVDAHSDEIADIRWRLDQLEQFVRQRLASLERQLKQRGGSAVSPPSPKFHGVDLEAHAST